MFRIFDALNDVEQMRPAIEAVRETGTTVAEVALCYTGDLSSPDEKLYTLDYYLRLAEQIVDAGAHVLAIKDMAGLLRAPAARTLVTALRERFDLPVHLHTHDTPGGQLGTLLAAIDAGVDAVDAACALDGRHDVASRRSPRWSPPPTTPPARPGSSLAAVNAMEPYWEAVRRVYAPFESGLPAPTGRVYRHEIPGGQLSNLRQQAIALGLGEKFEQVEDMYAAANDILGHIPKVTPSSKVVGDLALALVGLGADPAEFAENPAKFDIPDSVIGFLNGELGDPPGGWPEPFRTKALEGRTWKPPASEVTAEQAAALRRRQLADPPRDAQRAAVPRPDPRVPRGPARPTATCRCCRPSTTSTGCGTARSTRSPSRRARRSSWGSRRSASPTSAATGRVMATINGQLRPISVRDRAVASEVAAAEKADPSKPGHVAAPFQGVVTTVVAEGDKVAAGEVVATIEAMKMEASITAPVDGTVERLALSGTQAVDGGDLVLVLA